MCSVFREIRPYKQRQGERFETVEMKNYDQHNSMTNKINIS